METQKSKLFIGGISNNTKEETLKNHFIKYGEVEIAEVMKDKFTGYPRGFGFVTFSDSSSNDRALQDKHVIQGRKVEVKVARPKTEKLPGYPPYNMKKVFVGALPSDLTCEKLKEYFAKFGNVTDAVILQNKDFKPRDYGFVTYDSEEPVENVLNQGSHVINNRRVYVNRALQRQHIDEHTSNGSMPIHNFYQPYYCDMYSYAMSPIDGNYYYYYWPYYLPIPYESFFYSYPTLVDDNSCNWVTQKVEDVASSSGSGISHEDGGSEEFKSSIDSNTSLGLSSDTTVSNTSGDVSLDIVSNCSFDFHEGTNVHVSESKELETKLGMLALDEDVASSSGSGISHEDGGSEEFKSSIDSNTSLGLSSDTTVSNTSGDVSSDIVSNCSFDFHEGTNVHVSESKELETKLGMLALDEAGADDKYAQVANNEQF